MSKPQLAWKRTDAFDEDGDLWVAKSGSVTLCVRPLPTIDAFAFDSFVTTCAVGTLTVANAGLRVNGLMFSLVECKFVDHCDLTEAMALCEQTARDTLRKMGGELLASQ